MMRPRAAIVVLLVACSNAPVDVSVEAIDCTNEVACGAYASCVPFEQGNRCECDAGFSGDGTTCTDIDECAGGTDDCVANATCANDDGTFACTCDDGFQGDGRVSGTGCVNVDECDLSTDDCVNNTTCEDTDGDYICHCPPGTHGDGRVAGTGCADDNECTLGTHDCVSLATCQDAPGGYTCECDPGYFGDGTNSGNGCSDINECSVGSDDCLGVAQCQNQVPGYVCDCPSGYWGDGTISGNGCNDINECSQGTDDCASAAQCIDEDGTFDCQCPSGYTGDGHSTGTGCTDINECSAGSDDCVPAANCRNEVPGYTCDCGTGYSGDGTVSGTGCTDIDECADGTDDCDVNAGCTNTPAGSFTCTCHTGWDGDGKTCDPVGWHQHTATTPGARWWPAAAGVPAVGVVVYGGLSGSGAEDDEWAFDGSSWNEACNPCDPGARTGHNLIYDSNNNRLLLFGGSTTNDYTGATNELWAGTGTGSWALLTPGGTAPSARWGASAEYDDSRNVLVVFGGQDAAGVRSDELFEYDGTDWSGPIVATGAPVARDGAASFSQGGVVYFYGGEGNGGYLDDLISWNGSAWATLGDVTARARTASVMFVSPTNGFLLIANGYDGEEIAGTWSTEAGVPMGHVFPALPPARDSSALAFDPVRQVFVLYGGNGNSCGGNCDEAWEYYPFP